MQRYRWPGYEMQLLGELQRQQNSATFCDTLLQTEGISVPTHSCVLAALSPYLSQKLSASPSPPSGQKHQVQLQAAKAQTLLKLVGLLYSGELEVKGGIEQNDVLALARRFGIAELLEGQKDRGMKEAERRGKRQSRGSCRENGFNTEESRGREQGRKMRDAQVQAEMAGRRDVDSPVEKRSCISTGTQTVKAVEKSVGSSVALSGQATPPTPESAPSVAQSLDFSVMLQPQNITLNKPFCSTSCPVIISTPSTTSGAPSDGESPLNCSFGTVTNPTSTPALSSDMLTFSISLNDDSKSPRRQEDGTYQRSSEFWESIQGLAEDRTDLESGKRNGKMADFRGDTEQPSQVNRDEMAGEGGNSTEKRHVHANVGMKTLAKMKQMQQMMETTQISIKVKLRRRTKGEVWEVVNMQDSDATLSVLTSLKQDGCKNRRPDTDLLNVPAPPSTVQSSPIQKPDSHILQPVTTNSPKSPPHPNASSDSAPPSSDYFTPNQKDGLEVAPPLQHQGSVEESDVQIEKLPEDIMMGLNILPNLERDCKRSHHLQLSHDGVPAICQGPVTRKDAGHSQMHAAVSAAGCVFYQDLGTRSFNSSADKGIHCCFTAQNQPSCSSLSSVLLDTALIQQQQERSQQYPSSVRSMRQRDGMSCQDMPLSKSQECLYPEVSTTRSVVPSAVSPAEQKLHHPAFQELSSQDNQQILAFLPLTKGNETQSMHTLSLPCMDDLRLPRCLSPLEPCTLETKHQPALNNPTSHGDKIQQQPLLHRRPWLAENPGSLQFRLSAITHRKNTSASLPQRTTRNCWSKKCQEHMELNPQNRGTWTESCTAKEVEERETVSAGQPNNAGLKSDPRKMKECDTTEEGIAPKRRKTTCTSHPQDAADFLLAYKDVKVSDGTKSKINWSVCQVSLSSNNVLAKERALTTSSSNIPSEFIGKQNQPSSVTECLRENARGSGVNTDQTRIRTRSFLKNTQESPSDTSPETSFGAKPMVHRAKTVNKQGVTSGKRGRPPKTKLQVLTPLNNRPAVAEKRSHNEESQQKTESNSPKEDLEKGNKTKRRCKKRWINRSAEVGIIPLKKTISVESIGKRDADIDIIPKVRKLQTPKEPQTVTLNEFQKLIKRSHSKSRRSKESQETNEMLRDAESEGAASRDNTCKESTKESKNPDEGTTCDTGVSNATQQTAITDEGLSHRLVPDYKLHPQTPERTGLPLPDAGGISGTSGCDQEEEEEVEVDVLLYSPVQVPQARVCGDGLDSTEITPDEEEEEDVNEIDVTGDETE
ncbi:uncharacterized protein LOC120800780 isoform X2 [Xiphias gladius]|nr:uncharacterized protein LOC120800780 isoform X2 [Xiphias gladius]XP_040003067.1 uncharacterized protein LOC120800780 isoform X2 [Xiphias gladius]